MKKHEILAPVGADEQLRAAVRCGADAVYLGTGDFNARRNADNFKGVDLNEAVKYCKLRNVKVYVTLNTLIFDKEAEKLYKTVEEICKSGADAIIVQDFFAVKVIREICPRMSIHASTQMAVHNVAGAKLLEEMGFSRIVLARELSLAEIKEIRKNVNAELEVFVHGAHCMSASGNCYLSAMLGERSGNRGLCAQGCRLNWLSRHGREYALSLKDMSYLDSISELADCGIESFKIEGRMKRPEYVAAAVTSLKKALNGEFYDKETLRSVFSRSGFTDGYLKGEKNLNMFGYRNKDDVTSATAVLKDLENLYRNDIHPIEATARFTLTKNEPCRLELSAEGRTVSVTGDIPEAPRNAPLSYEIALRNLSKLGDTSFYLDSLEFSNNYGLTLSASSVNAVRRDAVARLEEELLKNELDIASVTPEKISAYSPDSSIKARVRLEKFSQYSEKFDNAEFIILPIDEIIKNEEAITSISTRIIAELPHLIYPHNEQQVTEKLSKIKSLGITHGATGNIGGIKILKDAGFTIHGTHGLNITNTASLITYDNMGLSDATVSFELSEKNINQLGGTIARGAYIYGYLPLMLMRACPQKSINGCGNCNGMSYLTDRKSIQFPLICQGKEFTVLHNSIPLYIGDKNLRALDFGTLYFTIESKEECEEIYNAFLQRKPIPGKKTNGLFNRELL